MERNASYIHAASPVMLSALNAGSESGASLAARAFVSAFAPALLVVSFAMVFAGCFTSAALMTFMAAGVACVLAFGVLGNAAAWFRRSVPQVALLACAVCLVGTLFMTDARAGMFSCVNVVIAHYNTEYGTYIGLLSNGSMVCASFSFAVLFGIVAGVVSCVLTRMRHTAVSLLAVVLLGAFSLRLDLGVAIFGEFLGIAAWLVQCRLTQLEHATYPFAYLAGILAGLLMVSVASFAACEALYTPSDSVAGLHDSVKTASQKARFGSDSLPEGNMLRAATMNESDKDGDCGLSIKFDDAVSSDVLLRGFVGADFDGEAWSKLGWAAYEGSWKGLFGWMAGEGFVPAEQRAEFDDERAAQNQVPDVSTDTIEVNAENANARYVYVPYTLRSVSAQARFDLDGSFLAAGFTGARSYHVSFDDVPVADVFADASWLEGSTSAYARAESVYAEFVKENYLDVDSENADIVREYIFNPASWNRSAAMSDYSIISRVRTMLSTLASYTENPIPAPSDQPFVAWFLGDAREGNSAYFATAATLAFRSQGIPARYVEGYLADAGDVSNAAAAGEALALDADDAHAWCEIYLDGVGWTPIEVTPGYFTQALDADSIVDVGEVYSSGSKDIVMNGESVAGELDEDKPTAPKSVPVAMAFALSLTIVFGLSAGVLVVAALAQRLYRAHRRKRFISSDVQTVCVPALYRYLSAIMGASGCGFDRERPLDCLPAFQERFKGIDVFEYRRVVELHQAYAFGERELRPNELRTLRRFTQRLHEELPLPVTVRERFDRYFVRAL